MLCVCCCGGFKCIAFENLFDLNSLITIDFNALREYIFSLKYNCEMPNNIEVCDKLLGF